MNILNLSDLLPTLQFNIVALDSNRVSTWWNFHKINSPFSRLFLIRKGFATVVHHRQTFHLKAGMMHVIPSFVDCDYHCSESMELSYIHFTSRLAGGIDFFSQFHCECHQDLEPMSLSYFDEIKQLLPRRILQCTDPSSKDNMVIPSHSSTEHPEESPAGRLKADALFRLLIYPFIQSATDLSPAMQKLSSLRLVFEYIDNNLNGDLSLDVLATLCRQSPNYLSAQFYQATGIRPIAYITKKRIEAAQHLLLKRSNHVKHVAYQSGFSSPAYFSRAFKKHMGVSPETYRDHNIGGLMEER